MFPCCVVVLVSWHGPLVQHDQTKLSWLRICRVSKTKQPSVMWRCSIKLLGRWKKEKSRWSFLSNVPIEDWRLICISDAGHAKRANGDSQGGYLLGLTNSLMRDRKLAPMWLVDWASKKLKRVVRSSTAAETHAGNDALDAIEFSKVWWQKHCMV